MILACQKLLGQITKVLGFGETLPPRMGKTPKKSRIFFLRGSLSYHLLPKVVNSCQKLSKPWKTTKKHRKPPMTTPKPPKSCLLLPKVTKCCHLLPKVTKCCQKLPNVGKNSCILYRDNMSPGTICPLPVLGQYVSWDNMSPS